MPEGILRLVTRCGLLHGSFEVSAGAPFQDEAHEFLDARAFDQHASPGAR